VRAEANLPTDGASPRYSSRSDRQDGCGRPARADRPPPLRPPYAEHEGDSEGGPGVRIRYAVGVSTRSRPAVTQDEFSEPVLRPAVAPHYSIETSHARCNVRLAYGTTGAPAGAPGSIASGPTTADVSSAASSLSLHQADNPEKLTLELVIGIRRQGPRTPHWAPAKAGASSISKSRPARSDISRPSHDDTPTRSYSVAVRPRRPDDGP